MADQKGVRVISRRQAVAKQRHHLGLWAEINDLRRAGREGVEERPRERRQFGRRPAANGFHQRYGRRRQQNPALFPGPQCGVGALPFTRLKFTRLDGCDLSGRQGGAKKGSVETEQREWRRNEAADVSQVVKPNRQAEAFENDGEGVGIGEQFLAWLSQFGVVRK